MAYGRSSSRRPARRTRAASSRGSSSRGNRRTTGNSRRVSSRSGAGTLRIVVEQANPNAVQRPVMGVMSQPIGRRRF